jgi:hypothetical protein
MTMRTLLLASRLWILVSHITLHQCTRGVCVPDPTTPLASTKALGQFATLARWEQVRAALAERWEALEREVDAQAEG